MPLACLAQLPGDLLGSASVVAIRRQKSLCPGAQGTVAVLLGVAVQARREVVALLFDKVEYGQIGAVLYIGLLHLGAVFVDVHVFVGLAEQFPHGGHFQVGGKTIADRVAQRHFGVVG